MIYAHDKPLNFSSNLANAPGKHPGCSGYRRRLELLKKISLPELQLVESLSIWLWVKTLLPPGKQPQKTMENPHFSWENPLSMAIFNSYVTNYQRVLLVKINIAGTSECPFMNVPFAGRQLDVPSSKWQIIGFNSFKFYPLVN